MSDGHFLRGYGFNLGHLQCEYLQQRHIFVPSIYIYASISRLLMNNAKMEYFWDHLDGCGTMAGHFLKKKPQKTMTSTYITCIMNA